MLTPPDHEFAEPLAKLEALGSPDQIALYLDTEGITGARGNAAACPVAHYLYRETGRTEASSIISVGPHRAALIEVVQPPAVWDTGFCFEVTKRSACDVPEPVREFILAFDNEDYPELDNRSRGSW